MERIGADIGVMCARVGSGKCRRCVRRCSCGLLQAGDDGQAQIFEYVGAELSNVFGHLRAIAPSDVTAGAPPPAATAAAAAGAGS